MAKLYKSFEINEFDLKTAKKEYKRMQKIAAERIERAKKYETEFYIEDIPAIPKLSEIKTNNDIYKNLKEINEFLKNPFSRIRYVQSFENKTLKGYRSAGYKWINKKNVRFVNWALWMIEKHVPDNFNYDEALDFIEQLERINLSESDFYRNIEILTNLYSSNTKGRKFQNALKEVKPIKTGREMKYSELKKRLKNEGFNI